MISDFFTEWFIPQRYVLGLMGFLALANGYIQRFCLSLAITEMVKHTSEHSAEDPHSCPVPIVNHTDSESVHTEVSMPTIRKFNIT